MYNSYSNSTYNYNPYKPNYTDDTQYNNYDVPTATTTSNNI